VAVLALLGAVVYAGSQRHHEVTLSAQAITDSSTTTTTLPRPAKSWGAYRPFTATVSGANGRTRIEQSLNCNAGGDGSYWHFQSEAGLPAGIITGPQSTLPGDLRVFAAVNSPYHVVRSTPEPVPGPTQNDAFLLPDGSHAALTNQRGSVKLGLSSGACPVPRDQTGPGFTLDFDGLTAATNEQPGSWSILDAAGSYREAKSPGDGRFDLTANVSPGADDPWSMTLRGSIAVLQPALDVRVVNTYWGRDGVDYASRQVAVTYQVTNVGYGDAFDVRLTNAMSPTPGASLIAVIVNGDNLLIDGNTPVGAPQRSLGDLSELETTTLTLKWQLPLPAGNPPCGLVILNCQFDTTLTFSVPDAMDVPITPTPVVTLHATAPNLPPPA
jgi:hypothetical protein